MSRGRDIFERIKTEGMSALKFFVEDRVSEELFLDFKRSADNGSGAKLHNKDRENLSKCISGFGNSEGGVIVWGVDCSNDSTGADVAHSLYPIKDPKRFRSLLEGVVSGCTIPPHSGIENHVIEEKNGEGYVITLIPRSIHSPHQSVQNKHYYIRAGSSFVPTPHDVLAGMFGRRPQPHVFNHFILSKPSFSYPNLSISFGIMLHNRGPGIASDLFAICRFQQVPGQGCKIKFETPDHENWAIMKEFDMQLSSITRAGVRLPPGANLQPYVVHLTLSPPFDKALLITGTVGASNCEQYRFEVGNSAALISEQYELFRQKTLNNTLSGDESRSIAEAILGVHMHK
ncbi:MAG: hypothetical protein CMK89_19985 [Pseudomonadales bacterium]|nr:hypothetical protein [Pseudomonadales bacterium]